MLIPLFALVYLLAIYVLLTVVVTKREKFTANSSSDVG